MALEAITSPYLSNFVPNKLHSSSSFPFAENAADTQTHEIGFFFNGNVPPLPSFPPTNWVAPYSPSPPSPSSSSCLSSSAVGHLLSPMKDKKLDRSSSAENQITHKKRRRSRSLKNSQELEKQRMTHITVERNRRKQMNEHLAVLRSLMPGSYIQRGDQASIVGGAIDFVKELEQLVQSLEVLKREKNKRDAGDSPPFASFFTCPQYSFRANRVSGEPSPEESLVLADIQVTMSETHASLKVRTLRRPSQLLRMVAGLQGLRLTLLHLNVTTTEPFVLYSFSTKVEEDCKLNTADEIASAVHQILLVIRETVLMGGYNAKSEEDL